MPPGILSGDYPLETKTSCFVPSGLSTGDRNQLFVPSGLSTGDKNFFAGVYILHQNYYHSLPLYGCAKYLSLCCLFIPRLKCDFLGVFLTLNRLKYFFSFFSPFFSFFSLFFSFFPPFFLVSLLFSFSPPIIFPSVQF